jgi:phytoene dehydrogenase-like protein
MHGFADSIVHEAVYTPVEWKQRYNCERGAVFGLAHGLDQLAIFRPRCDFEICIITLLIRC